MMIECATANCDRPAVIGNLCAECERRRVIEEDCAPRDPRIAALYALLLQNRGKP